MNKKVRAKVAPFTSGSEFCSWHDANCDDCTKMNWENPTEGCDIECALSFACIDDGEVYEDLIIRAGWIDGRHAPAVCKEKRES